MNVYTLSNLTDMVKEGLHTRRFLKQINLTAEALDRIITRTSVDEAVAEVAFMTNEDGRFRTEAVPGVLKRHIPVLVNEPSCGWLKYCYYYILARIYPENVAYWTDDHIETVLSRDDEYGLGRAVVLQILRSLYRYERRYLPFSPLREMRFLSPEEIIENGFSEEYLKLRDISTEYYIYEFMRIGCAITPYDTLGHIGGVHYVAVYAARQLFAAGVPVDVALVSGAAAVHDIGKYGSKKSEERRVPYLHYFYTDLCCRRVGIPEIGHIAANHSVWDLELENLPVEALLLIYADFRVKSRRENGREKVCFYTLKEAFDVILQKLDNVDEAKKHRYQRVYEKLADFEQYMTMSDVNTVLPDDFSDWPASPGKRENGEPVLQEGESVVRALTYTAIDHNIRMMRLFQKGNEFSRFLEGARSERSWKNVRNYISTLEEYFTYMTERQKTITLQFLYEILSYQDVDIRMQAARLMGNIVATFEEKYRKEIPEGVTLPPREVTSAGLFAHYMSLIVKPGWRFTQQHRNWISYCLGEFVQSALQYCDEDERREYLDILQRYYSRTNYQSEIFIVLLTALNRADIIQGATGFIETLGSFIEAALSHADLNVRVAALRCKATLVDAYDEEMYFADLLKTLKLSANEADLNEESGALFLDNLKMSTHWVIKAANIEILLHFLQMTHQPSSVMHLGTHLANVLKVSESCFVRAAAGAALLRVASHMTFTQRNEIAVELFNGLELGDLRISKYVPEYLGRLVLQLSPSEVDEFIGNIENQIVTATTHVAASMVHTVGVMVGNFQEFAERFPQEEIRNESRKRRLLYIMIKTYAHFNRELSRDAFRQMGRFIFANPVLSLDEVDFFFSHAYKKLLVLLSEQQDEALDFYNNAAVLNHIYRYIGIHRLERERFDFAPPRKVCFYPGTFDPFSLGHKAIAIQIRDLGFDVYLALDEFSWSKHTQPRLMRRKIMNMSVADKEHIYPFPDDISINMANPSDLKRLKEIFAGRELYLAVGTDVIENASAYRNEPSEHSVHTLNHIAFERETRDGKYDPESFCHPIQGDLITLKLDKFYEDISSTRIRENIDLNRDISNLIDAVAQQFIYENNLYLREPAYKHVFDAKNMDISLFETHQKSEELPSAGELNAAGYDGMCVSSYVCRDDVRSLYIEWTEKERQVIAYAAAHHVGIRELHTEFGDTDIASRIREAAEGSVASIGFLYTRMAVAAGDIREILITELMTALIAQDYAYALYHPVDAAGGYGDEAMIEALQDRGFQNIAPPGADPVYAVSLKSPVVLFRDVETVLKNPFNKNLTVLQALDKAHERLLETMRRIYPGKLILSFTPSVVHKKIINEAVRLNGVSAVNDGKRRYGPYMSVPFGKTLSDVLIPNTVTKALHIEKYFERSVRGFKMAESRYYSSVINQVKTIRSFNRPVMLIDDLLHKGYRMRMLVPYLEECGIDIKAVLTGVMTGRAADMMSEWGIRAECAYFLPTLEVWLNERDCYPFLGGDSIMQADGSGDDNPFINLVLPYVKPGFIGKGDDEAVYRYSLTCLKNALHIMETLQETYQQTFERRLTLKRLGEVVSPLRIPDMNPGVIFDKSMNPSRFIENDIEQLLRFRWKNS